MRKKFPTWLWGVVLVIGAVASLVVVAWLGLRGQQKSVWADARVECGLVADRLMKEMFDKDSQPLETTEVVLFPELPEPGTLTFDPEADWGRMLDLREQEGLTSGGVPIRILAGLAFLKKFPSEEGAMELANEAVSIAPSFLTPRILEEIRRFCESANIVIDHGQYDRRWQKLQLGREMIRANQHVGYRVYQGEIYWTWYPSPDSNLWDYNESAALEAFALEQDISSDSIQSITLPDTFVSSSEPNVMNRQAEGPGMVPVPEDRPNHERAVMAPLVGISNRPSDRIPNRWKFSGPDEIAQTLKNSLEREGLSKGRWMGAAMTIRKARLGEAGEVLATREIPGGVLEVGVIDAAGLEAGWREQFRWVVTMIALAVLAVGAGLWVMMLGVFKERKMAYAKSQFVASVTHELRAPVGSIRLMADALESGKVRTQKVGEFHRLMARESGRLSVLIENVMDLAKVEDGRRAIRLEEVELCGLVEEVCEMMAMQAEETGVRFEHSDQELVVTADPVALRQILVNLIDNAVKFSPREGTVRIGWEEGWSLTVADEGPGVPEGDREKIFERFYRGEDELRRTTKGVGIGLSLVKELAELQGGRVSVANEGGAVFKIEFRES